MIKNIIFDVGNVLISYDPSIFISKYIKSENGKKFFEIIFKSSEWEDLDRGTLEYSEAIKIFSKKLPEEKKAIEKLFNEGAQGVLFPIKENLDLLSKLKKEGYKLFILSNFHKDAFLKMSNICKFSDYFDGKIISYEVHLLKPEKEIYLELLNRYGLKAEESLFIDDTLKNIEACEKLGIKGIHLKNKEDLKKELERVVNFKNNK